MKQKYKYCYRGRDVVLENLLGWLRKSREGDDAMDISDRGAKAAIDPDPKDAEPNAEIKPASDTPRQ